MKRLAYALLWFACAAFVAYLSLIPFRFAPLAFDEALARFAQIPYLDLGAARRADWVANILMFIPLGWLAAAFFVPHPHRRFDPVAILPALVLGSAWAVAIEFGQLYFPNRTVSVNDIVAEVLGSLAGALLWSALGARSRDWWRTLLQGGRATRHAALAAYLLAYLLLSLSPFDLVISADELSSKIASDLYGWWLAPVSCGRVSCGGKLIVEMLAVLPFGWWWAMRRGAREGSLASAALLGAGVGVLIELAQFLLVSGTSQGASVVSRAVGVAGGAVLYLSRRRFVGIDWARWGRPVVLAAVVPYLVAVAFVGGWFSDPRLGLDAGLRRVPGIQWMPFFYQYFTTEQALIRSTLVHLVLYLPVGLAVWLWGRRTNSAPGWAAAALAAGIAIVVETGKLFLVERHPDYTDVLFAMIAAWTSATLLRWASRAAREAADAPRERPLDRGAPSARNERPLQASRLIAPGLDGGPAAATEVVPFAGGLTDSWLRRASGTAVLLLVAVSLARFPVWQVPLAAGLAAYAWLLWCRPLAYLLVIPAALPLLDLAPLSGRFFWDEFDFLLATTAGVRLLMVQPPARARPDLPKFALSMMALSVLASTAIALWPLPRLDAVAFASYLSPYNALRVAKGYLWAGALLSLLWLDTATGRHVGERLRLGLALGLLAATLGVFLERLLFLGVADLGGWFRAAGLVSATHVGGAYLEAMLVVLTPFALAQAVTSQRARIGALWFSVALLGAAAVLMTISRAAASAWFIGVAVFAASWWLGSRRRRTARAGNRWRLGAAAAGLALVTATALMSQAGDLRDRLALSGSDLGVRLEHWRETLDLIRIDALHAVFGMGLGSFPREFYLAQAAPLQMAAYRVEREVEAGRPYLLLAGGRGMFIDQRVATSPGRELRLSGQVRSSRDGARLAIALCEKSFLSSARCDWRSVPATIGWQPFEARLSLPEAADNRIGPRAPVSLSLHNDVFGTRIDVTELSLLDGSVELVANGSFDRGLDHWLMFSDVHLAWRALNTPVQMIFEQGFLGVLAWLVIGIAVLAATARRTDIVPRAAVVASVTGFMIVGCFDTLLDAPRLVVLASLVLWLGLSANLHSSRAACVPTD